MSVVPFQKGITSGGDCETKKGKKELSTTTIREKRKSGSVVCGKMKKRRNHGKGTSRLR